MNALPISLLVLFFPLTHALASLNLRGGFSLHGATIESDSSLRAGLNFQLGQTWGKRAEVIFASRVSFGQITTKHFAPGELTSFPAKTVLSHIGLGPLFKYIPKTTPVFSHWRPYFAFGPVWSFHTLKLFSSDRKKLTSSSNKGGILLLGLERSSETDKRPLYIELSYEQRIIQKTYLVRIINKKETEILQAKEVNSPRIHSLGINFGMTFF